MLPMLQQRDVEARSARDAALRRVVHARMFSPLDFQRAHGVLRSMRACLRVGVLRGDDMRNFDC